MDLFYFFVTSHEQYADKFGFHNYYFVEGNFPAFTEGFLYSAGIGGVVALAFYFGLCNGESAKHATRVNWGIGLLLVALAAYFIGDIMIIGSDGNPGSGFYGACQDFAREFMEDNRGNTQALQECQMELKSILEKLRKGKDVALTFNVTNAVLSMLFYFLTSIGVKNFTKHGSQIPFQIPF